MKQTVWILNHYCGSTLFSKGGRHYWIAKFLKIAGYDPIIFASNSKLGIKKRYVDSNDLWVKQIAEELSVPYIYVRSMLYSRNGIGRIVNMIQFYHNVQKAGKQYAKLSGKPDVIYASSVHPLTLVAGQKLAKYFDVPCICEVRDLWPESLVAYGHLKRKSLLAKLLYSMEKRIYKKADRVVMTWPGGYDYIRDRGWEKEIPEEKVIHISNGVDLAQFKSNMQANPYTDDALQEQGVKKIIYAGSIREVNNLAMIVDAAKILQDRGVTGVKLLIYGDGNEREALMRRVEKEKLNNILFAGSVPKRCVPAVLNSSYVTLLHNSSTELDRYGQSQNKFFEYLSAGKPILMTYSVGHSVCKENRCGIEVEHQSPEAIADAIEMVAKLDDETYAEYCRNAENTAKQYDFANLTQKLIQVIETL